MHMKELIEKLQFELTALNGRYEFREFCKLMHTIEDKNNLLKNEVRQAAAKTLLQKLTQFPCISVYEMEKRDICKELLKDIIYNFNYVQPSENNNPVSGKEN